MIRDYLVTDIDSINEIGLLINSKFKDIYKLNDINKDYSNIYVYIEENQVVGFLHYEEHYEVIDIINIAVAKKNQNKGIGESLINYLINNTHGEKIMLEVNANNIPAIKLYNNCNFKEIHRRTNYYGKEDALIMERVIRK